MFELEKDERIRGIDPNTAALSMAMAHDFILEILLTRDMLETGPDEARKLARLAIERWERRYGQGPDSGVLREDDRERLRSSGKAFVDRLMRKALARSDSIREQLESQPPTADPETGAP
jgi:hypothetical protein